VTIGYVKGPGGIAPKEIAQQPRRAFDPAVELPARTQPPVAQPDAATEVEQAIPLQAPPGTDPELWSLLTAEERRFFSKLHETGPLTYGPKTANTPPGLMRGGRFDRTV
jgi:hypothetical protein